MKVIRMKGQSQMLVRSAMATAGLAAVTFFGAAGMASAKITQYECRFTQGQSRGGGWISEILVVTDNDKTGEILAYDPVIKTFVGKPIPARRSAETKARVTFGWDVDIRVKDQSSRMTYTMSYFRNGQPAKMRAQPGGYDNTWTGEGTCKVSVR